MKSNPFTIILAAAAGAALMIPISLTVISSSVQHTLGGQLAGLSSKLVQMENADLTTSSSTSSTPTSCQLPSGSTTTNIQAPVHTPAVVSNWVPASPSVTPPVVDKIITGQLNATTNGTISDTGPNSVNKIDTTNTNTTAVTTTNDVVLTNTNDQSSNSGSASSSDNTTAGDTTSGDSSNTNDTNVSLLFKTQ